jgi:hypothetical protein
VPSDRDAAPEPEPQRHVRLACQSPASGTLFSQSKPATSNHYFPLRTNQHQPSATSQTNWLNQNQAEFRAHHTELVMISVEQSRCGSFTTDCVSNFRPSLKNRICFSACTRGGQLEKALATLTTACYQFEEMYFPVPSPILPVR